MKVDWLGSLWIQTRYSGYRVLITGDLKNNLGAKIIYLYGHHVDDDKGKPYWYLDTQSDVETIINLYGNDELIFDAKVTSLLNRNLIQKPPGNQIPQQATSNTIQYIRNPNVKAWVLKEANGIYELCSSQAQFFTTNKIEVHHLKMLVDGGF